MDGYFFVGRAVALRVSTSRGPPRSISLAHFGCERLATRRSMTLPVQFLGYALRGPTRGLPLLHPLPQVRGADHVFPRMYRARDWCSVTVP